MDKGTIIGVAVCFIAVTVTAVLKGVNLLTLLNPAALILIFVGTFGAASASLLMSEYKLALGGFKRAFGAKQPDASGLVDVIVAMADRARREGLLALEDMAKDINDPLLKEGIQMTVDGTDADEIAELLEARITSKKDTDKVAVTFFENMGGYAPTIGVVGAVLGLITALSNLDDVGRLGYLIASAFVATMWGVLIANGAWMPIAGKLKRLSQLEVANMEMIVEGVLAVQAGTSPRMVEQKLRSALPGGGVDPKAAKAA
ncbi:chemotaxis protein MotA [Kineosphaera limosa]|uniref:Chemotaxis MotA protein n=1 Tax=Kineosphaera limosa NBRC 100340 TaxID=1184609 RepID=K6X0L6_9MICO|nr:MotA/TolQ/ExbB proton channel family protein [Kineosphaera limosa]NYD99794.1 chemotaxis protein MotA [Kineosphaera limosa]GAB97892.1 chemotaxis MotA protein [Kineosphaera limosa NBRC 100340]